MTDAARTTAPEADVETVRRWAATKWPATFWDEVRMEVDVHARGVDVMECRAPWSPDHGPDWTRFPIARLVYVKTHAHWLLHWRDRNLRWHRYDRLPPCGQVTDLLAEVDADPTGIFWG